MNEATQMVTQAYSCLNDQNAKDCEQCNPDLLNI